MKQHKEQLEICIDEDKEKEARDDDLKERVIRIKYPSKLGSQVQIAFDTLTGIGIKIDEIKE